MLFSMYLTWFFVVGLSIPWIQSNKIILLIKNLIKEKIVSFIILDQSKVNGGAAVEHSFLNPYGFVPLVSSKIVFGLIDIKTSHSGGSIQFGRLVIIPFEVYFGIVLVCWSLKLLRVWMVVYGSKSVWLSSCTGGFLGSWSPYIEVLLLFYGHIIRHCYCYVSESNVSLVYWIGRLKMVVDLMLFGCRMYVLGFVSVLTVDLTHCNQNLDPLLIMSHISFFFFSFNLVLHMYASVLDCASSCGWLLWIKICMRVRLIVLYTSRVVFVLLI